jgi:hypothetical protein
MRRIAGFLIASVSASLLFFAIFIPGGLLLSGRLAEWTMRIDGVAVLVWAVLGWPVVAIVGLFPRWLLFVTASAPDEVVPASMAWPEWQRRLFQR